MPRKPKVEKQTTTVMVNGKPIAVTLHPPRGNRKTWYAFWTGLKNGKATGERQLEAAIVAVHAMLQGGGKKVTVADATMSDAEFEAIQRAHFARKTDPAAQRRAQKTLDDCLEAIAAFRDISGLTPITTATPDGCAAFQRKALTLPKNWRKKYPNSKEAVKTISPNTILKWSRALQAAFDRANRNAGRKSVRGIVAEIKLLHDNPWKQFTWVEGTSKPIRQFDAGELVGLLDFFHDKWPGITVAALLAKVCLWSWGRRAEVTGLRWDALRQVGNEHHFEITGKWGIEKWFRVPERLFDELRHLRTNSPFVFAAYPQQLQAFYQGKHQPLKAQMVSTDFKPVNLGDWFHEQIVAWSIKQPKGKATTHVFRKTSLQYARSGEDVNRQVAADACLSEGVLMTNYVKETDEQMRQKSNRMYRRILMSLEDTAAQRYGVSPKEADPLSEKIKQAAAAEDWETVAALIQRRRSKQRTRTG